MKEIENFLNRVCRFLRVAPSLKKHIREELQEHVVEAMEAHRKEGLSEEEALQRAIEEFGSPDTVGDQLSSIHSQNFFSFVLDRAMVWRERTMKTGWKWNFVALTAMALVIGIESLMSMACAVYVLPRVTETFKMLGLPFPRICDGMLTSVRFFRDYWFVPLCILGGGWTLFEFKCRRESKSSIRLASFAAVCVATTVLFIFASFGTMLPAAMVVAGAALAPSYTRGLDSAAMVSLKLTEADILFSQLSDACEKENWDAAGDSARDLYIIMQSLYLTRDLASMTGSPKSSEESEEMREVLYELNDQSITIVKSVHAKEFSTISAQLAELKASYARFKQMTGLRSLQ